MTHDRRREVPSPVGVLTAAGPGRATIRVERWYAAPPAQVWPALTDAGRLARWLGPVEGDLTAGGGYRIAWSEEPDQVVTGVVQVCDAPRRLEVSWDIPGEDSSRVGARLDEADGGTRLVLEHEGLSRPQGRGYGAGWHAYLDVLAALLEGRPGPDWVEAFRAVLPRYEAQLPAEDDPSPGMAEVAEDMITFRRRLPTDLADAWTLVNDPDRIRRWFAPVTVERAEVGSPWATTWDDGREYARGVVRRCEAPHLVEVTWTASDDADPGSADSILRVELREVAGGVELVLAHTGLGARDLVLYGAGWHTYLDRLPRGTHWPEVAWSARFEELRGAYEEAVRVTRR